MKTKLLKKLRKQAREAYWVKKQDNGKFTVENEHMPSYNYYTLENAIKVCDRARSNHIKIKLRYVDGYYKKQYDRVY